MYIIKSFLKFYLFFVWAEKMWVNTYKISPVSDELKSQTLFLYENIFPHYLQ